MSHTLTESDPVDTAAALLRDASRVLVLSGAGISTDSGIPDFRGPDGLWTRQSATSATIEVYKTDPQARERMWQRFLSDGAAPVPNAGHRAVLELERSGKLLLLVTQNVDGLHQVAGTDPALMVEFHGSARESVCLDCGDRTPIEVTLARVRGGATDPHCLRCLGLLKPGVTSFDQELPPGVFARADAAARECDVILAVGTTLLVFPVAGLVPVAQSCGAKVIIVNRDPTLMDELADVLVRGEISQVLPRLVRAQETIDCAPAV